MHTKSPICRQSLRLSANRGFLCPALNKDKRIIGIITAQDVVEAVVGAFDGVVAVLLVAIVISSLVGTLVPLLFHKIKIDPAVASGPLITTIDDLAAVVTYYGLAWVMLIRVLGMV